MGYQSCRFGANDLPETEGENLIPYLDNTKAEPPSRQTYCQYNMSPFFGRWHGVENWRSCLRRPWKYILHHNGEAELFDVVGDPGEKNNLAGSPEAQDKEKELKEVLLEWCRRTGDTFYL